MKSPRSLSLPFSLTSSPTNKINASLAALRSHSGIVCATYVDLRFLIARNGSHVPDDAEQSSKDERSHSRNQVTKKKYDDATKRILVMALFAGQESAGRSPISQSAPSDIPNLRKSRGGALTATNGGV